MNWLKSFLKLLSNEPVEVETLMLQEVELLKMDVVERTLDHIDMEFKLEAQKAKLNFLLDILEAGGDVIES